MKDYYYNLIVKSVFNSTNTYLTGSLQFSRKATRASFILLICLLGFSDVYSQQVPESFSYQAVVRDLSNNPFVNTTLGVQITILQGSANGSEVFRETHNPVSNDAGLITLEVGEGNNITGSISAINWEAGPYFIKQDIDPLNGTNYTISATTQLLSVPYSIYSKNSGRANSAATADVANALSAAGSSALGVPLGTVLTFAGPAGSVPSGWLLCDGSSYDLNAYPELYSLIGTTYGSEPNRFKVPNLLGRVPAGYDNAQSEFNALGKTGGAKTHTLSINEMPSHNHGGSTASDTHSHGLNYPTVKYNTPGLTQGIPIRTNDQLWSNPDNGGALSDPIRLFDDTHSHGIGSQGGSQAHNNLQPYLSVNFIIKAR